MPWNLQNADLHKYFLYKVSQPQAFHYGYRKFILLLQFLCRVLACLLWLQEGHGFPVFELCWSHLADLLWGQAPGMLCTNQNCFPLSSSRTQWMSQHLQRGRKDCDLGLLVVKTKGILVVKPVQRQGNSLTQVSRSLASFPWTSSGSNPPSFSLLLKLGLCQKNCIDFFFTLPPFPSPPPYYTSVFYFFFYYFLFSRKQNRR